MRDRFFAWAALFDAQAPDDYHAVYEAALATVVLERLRLWQREAARQGPPGAAAERIERSALADRYAPRWINRLVRAARHLEALDDAGACEDGPSSSDRSRHSVGTNEKTTQNALRPGRP